MPIACIYSHSRYRANAKSHRQVTAARAICHNLHATTTATLQHHSRSIQSPRRQSPPPPSHATRRSQHRSAAARPQQADLMHRASARTSAGSQSLTTTTTAGQLTTHNQVIITIRATAGAGRVRCQFRPLQISTISRFLSTGLISPRQRNNALHNVRTGRSRHTVQQVRHSIAQSPSVYFTIQHNRHNHYNISALARRRVRQAGAAQATVRRDSRWHNNRHDQQQIGSTISSAIRSASAVYWFASATDQRAGLHTRSAIRLS